MSTIEKESYENAIKMNEIYYEGMSFPNWTLDINHWKTFSFNTTVVYYDTFEELNDVVLLVKEREPCNMAMKQYYNKDKLETYFGWRNGAYCKSTPKKLMPNIAIYCKADVLLSFGFKKIHLINLIGYAFDTNNQPDFLFLKENGLNHIIQKYNLMWKKALACLIDLNLKKIKIFNVGGGNFAGPINNFIETIFEPAFLPLLPEFKKNNIHILGYDSYTKTFNGGFIPQCLETDDDVENTLYINAWDCWSMAGNGNQYDNSLDGYWGRNSNIALLCWSMTNPYIKYKNI